MNCPTTKIKKKSLDGNCIFKQYFLSLFSIHYVKNIISMKEKSLLLVKRHDYEIKKASCAPKTFKIEQFIHHPFGCWGFLELLSFKWSRHFKNYCILMSCFQVYDKSTLSVTQHCHTVTIEIMTFLVKPQKIRLGSA